LFYVVKIGLFLSVMVKLEEHLIYWLWE